jgi:hypothetical protein
LTAGTGVSITNGSNSITIGLTGGGVAFDTITPNSGTSPVLPDGSGNVGIVGSGSTTTVGGTNSLSVELTGLTNHNVLVGAGTSTITKVPPSATSGIPLVSAGSSADPAFGTAVVAGGGTGATSLTGVLTGNGTLAVTASAVTQYGVLIGGASNAVDSTAVGTAGDVLTSNGPGLAPTYQTPTSGTVTSVSGTADRITSTGGATPVIDIATTYVGQTSITTLGTIATGAWQGTAVGATYGGTAQTSYATGDILYASASNTLSKLAAGSNGQVLKLASGIPSWANSGSGGQIYTVTALTNASSPYTVLTTDYYFTCNTTSGTLTINLPNAPTTGSTWIIKDAAGTADTNNITVTTVGGSVTIDGSTSFVMNTEYESINVIFTGSAYEVF